MPAAKTRALNSLSLKKIGIIAGSGALPKMLAQSCHDKGIQPFIIAFDGQTNETTVQGFEHIWTSLGSVGKIMKTLKSHNVFDLVMIGGIRRPSFAEMKPDMKGAEILTRIGLKSLGDNDLLELLKGELAKEGFTVHGVQDFLTDLLTPKGVLGKVKPTAKMEATIRYGVGLSQDIGRLDIGQSVVVQQGMAIGVEAIEGTDELIRRCRGYFRKGEGAILVKTAKPQQDKSLDLPTIGPDTILNAVESGVIGIVIEAGRSILIEPDVVREIADKNNVFILGIEIGDYR